MTRAIGLRVMSQPNPNPSSTGRSIMINRNTKDIFTVYYKIDGKFVDRMMTANQIMKEKPNLKDKCLFIFESNGLAGSLSFGLSFWWTTDRGLTSCHYDRDKSLSRSLDMAIGGLNRAAQAEGLSADFRPLGDRVEAEYSQSSPSRRY